MKKLIFITVVLVLLISGLIMYNNKYITESTIYVTVTTASSPQAQGSKKKTASDAEYTAKVDEWLQTEKPEARIDAIVWSYAANDSPYSWEVYKNQGEVCARLREAKNKSKTYRPSFDTAIKEFPEAFAFQKVSDGWLVAYNRGEFGAALWWFSNDGKEKYKISNHQVKQFLEIQDTIYAIEGLAHLSISEGSLIQLHKTEKGKTWEARTIIKLPQSPEAFQRLKNGNFIIALSDSLIRLDLKNNIEYLVKNAKWGILYPNSLEISENEKDLYLGMMQYVAIFNIDTNRLRFCIPDASFLNKLPAKEEENIRKIPW